MESGKNRILEEDLAVLVKSLREEEPIERLRGKNVMVSGSTGLIGSLLVRTFAVLNRNCGLGMRIIPLYRNAEKVERIYGDMLMREDIIPIQADLAVNHAAEEILSQCRNNGIEDIGYILHCAAVTTSRTMVDKPVETIETAVSGTRQMLETAVKSRAEGFLYVSSMEVYGDMSVYGDAGGTFTTEEQLGYIDLKKVRSNYPETKRLCENMCIAYMHEYGVPVRIARLAQTFGAGILPWENRVFAQFARAAMEGRNIVLHTKGLSEGNYCYTTDCMQGLLTILLKGSDGEAYNVVNEETHTTIAGMAAMVAERITGGRIRLEFDIPEENTFGYAADTHLKLSGAKLMSLGWTPQVSLEEAYRRLIAYMEVEEHRTADGVLFLRRAEDREEDARFLYELRNDPLTRSNSFNSDPIEYEDHLQWFRKMMADPNREQYILMLQKTSPAERNSTESGQEDKASSDKQGRNAVPAGMIRMDRFGTDAAEISYGIAPEYRGKGFGTKILHLLETDILRKQDTDRIIELTGEVIAENTASSKAFLKNGYAETVNKEYICYRKTIV